MKYLSIQLPSGVKDYLKQQAQDLDVSLSVIIRDMIKQSIVFDQWQDLKNEKKMGRVL